MNKRSFLLFTLAWFLCVHAGFAEAFCSFNGKLDFSGKQFELKMDFGSGGTLSSRAAYVPDERLKINFVLDHLVTPLFDVSTDMELLFEIVADSESGAFISGKLTSRYPLINGRPVRDITGTFKVRDKKLLLEYFSVGDITGRGVIDLAHPFQADLAFHFTEIPMRDFLAFWSEESLELEARGAVTGEIRATGSLLRPLLLRGTFSSFYGLVDNLNYESIVFNAEGVYPVIHFAKSTVTPTEGLSFSLEGSVDLSDRENLENQIEALQKSPLVSETDTSLEWTIKRRETEGTSGKTELKYMRRKNQDGSFKEESDMLGIERSIEF
jgi:hypothetical protein